MHRSQIEIGVNIYKLSRISAPAASFTIYQRLDYDFSPLVACFDTQMRCNNPKDAQSGYAAEFAESPRPQKIRVTNHSPEKASTNETTTRKSTDSCCLRIHCRCVDHRPKDQLCSDLSTILLHAAFPAHSDTRLHRLSNSRNSIKDSE